MWISLQNGVHADSLGPSTITRWAEFMKLYVANEIPRDPAVGDRPQRRALRATSPTPARRRWSSRASPARPSVAAAKAIFKRDPRVRLLMDNGAGPQGPGSIGATWELGYGAWPPKQARPTTLLPRPERRARRQARQGGLGPLHRRPEAPARKQTLPGDGAEDAWKAQPPYNWAPVAAGKGLGFVSRRARQGHRDRRPVEPRPLAQVLGARHRPPGDAQRGPPRRQRDLRAERLAARLAPQARRASARRRSIPFPTHLKQDAAPLPEGQLRAGARADLPGGARVPRRARGSG